MRNNILKKILLSTLSLMAIGANAEAPQNINYQSVVRTTGGAVIANQIVYVKVEVVYDINGQSKTVYEETHTTNTNFNGSFVIKIGEGKNSTGSFSNIKWEDGNYSIRTATSTSEDMSDAAIAISSLSSVPYALYSLHSADSFSGYFDDLKNKPNMSDYAKVEDVPSYAVDTVRKILADYASTDDVEDLFTRGVRTTNYRIDSLKAITSSNRNLINELGSKDSIYVTKSDIAWFVEKDTLATFATKESVNSLKKSLESSIAEQGQIIADNKALTNATFNDMKEIHNLYAKKDTLRNFVLKSEMSNYATNDDVENISKSISSLASSINTSESKFSDLTKSVNNLSSTVSDNQKEAYKKIDSIKVSLNKVDEKIKATERKAEADDLVLENRISANESSISSLNSESSNLAASLEKEISAVNTKINKSNQSFTATIDSLSQAMESNTRANRSYTNKQIDSLAKAADSKLNALNKDLTKTFSKEISAINTKTTELDSTLKEHASVLATSTTTLASLENIITGITTWSKQVNAKNDSLAKELSAQKAKYKADSLKLEKRLYEDSLKAVAKYESMLELAKEYMKSADQYKTTVDNLTSQFGGKTLEEYVSAQISAALDAAGLTNYTTTITNLDDKIDNVNSTLDGKIDDTNNKLSQDIEDAINILDNKIDNVVGGLDDRVSELEKK